MSILVRPAGSERGTESHSVDVRRGEPEPPTSYTVGTAFLIPFSFLGSFDAQSLSKMNLRKPFLRIIFRYIFKATFSVPSLTLAAKHLKLKPEGEEKALE